MVQIQARISSIQQMASAATGSTASPTSVGGGNFEALLAQYQQRTGALDTTDVLGAPGFGADEIMANPSFGRSPAAARPLTTNDKLQKFLDLALEQNGDRYVMSHEVSLDDPNPDTFDCSELIEWAAKQVDVNFTDGSWLQYLDLKQRDALMPVEEALRTPGALLFSFSEEPQPGAGRPSQAHVAVSLGDGRTIEARGSEYGVGIFEAGDRFEWAGMIPDFA